MKYMGEKGDEEQLLAFLNVVLQKTGRNGIVSVDIEENKTFTAAIIGDKAGILDLRATTQEGVKVNIEVQLRSVGDMGRRSLYYRCREYDRGIKSGQKYRELPTVIAINIVDFDFIPVNEVHTSFHLWEDSHKDVMLTDALEIHFISMFKFRKLKEINIIDNLLHRWLAFFDWHTDESIIKKITEMDPTIKKVQEKIAFVSQDRETLRSYQMREMALSDYASGIDHARREAKQEGIVIGEQRGMTIGEQRGMAVGEQKTYLTIVRNAAGKGMTVENISELTGLSVKKVRDILKIQ
jgi:predicted transposase/invertase (TIGR01784 family)